MALGDDSKQALKVENLTVTFIKIPVSSPRKSPHQHVDLSHSLNRDCTAVLFKRINSLTSVKYSIQDVACSGGNSFTKRTGMLV